ncbi:MAG: hypothetical protein LUC22_02755 [Prevotella sp.]|nr:hypothetical protein [Prevotella sp.]
MNINTKDKFNVLTPATGMYLYDGKNISEQVFTPLGADTSKWKDITEEERDAIIAEREKEQEQEQETEQNE